MMMFSHQFHNCKARVYPYEKPLAHEVFYSYDTEICISAYRKENGRDVLLLWLHPNATHISSTTTTQLCRYLGERIHHYASAHRSRPYMPVNHVRMLITTGVVGDSGGVYARYMGSLQFYNDKALECACDGR